MYWNTDQAHDHNDMYGGTHGGRQAAAHELDEADTLLGEL